MNKSIINILFLFLCSCTVGEIQIPQFITRNNIDIVRTTSFDSIKDEELGTIVAKCYYYKLVNNRIIWECKRANKELKTLCFKSLLYDDEIVILNCTPLFNLSNILGNLKMKDRADKILQEKTNYEFRGNINNEDKNKSTFFLDWKVLIKMVQ